MRVLALAGLSTSLLGNAVAEIESDFSAGYTSDYIFRGGDVGTNLFDLTLEFSGAGNLGALGDLDWSAGIWYASYSATGGGSNNELDLYGEVSKSLNDMFDVAVGITNYSYFGNGGATDDDIEPYVSLSTAMGEISLGATAYYDEGPGDWYYEVSAAYDRELSDSCTLGLAAVIGFGDESDDFVGGTAALSFAVSDDITVTPHVSATFSDNLGDQTFGGVSVGFGF
jgi:hypothetical protein